MKPRKVMVTLEMRSDRPTRFLKDKDTWQTVVDHEFKGVNEVHQVTAQVVKEYR